VQGAGPAQPVAGAADRGQRLLAQRLGPVQVLPQGDPGQPAQGQGDTGVVAEAAGKLQALPEQRAGVLLGALPEGQHPLLVEGEGPAGVVGRGGRQGPFQPVAAAGDPPADPMKLGQPGRQLQRLPGPAVVEQPVEPRRQVPMAALDPLPPAPRVQSPEATAGLGGEGEEGSRLLLVHDNLLHARLVTVILAAGRGRRVGRGALLLPPSRPISAAGCLICRRFRACRDAAILVRWQRRRPPP
jgi:hypothetical protein